MKKHRTRHHHKQKLRARRRQQRRQVKSPPYPPYTFSELAFNFNKLAQSLSYSVTEWAEKVKPVWKDIYEAFKSGQVYAAFDTWQTKKLATSLHSTPLMVPKQHGSSPLLAAWYGSQMPSNVGSNLVSKHRDEFRQEVVHPDPHASHLFKDHPSPKSSLNNIIMDLNDNCGWTREQIADWLDTLDEQPIFYPNTCPDDCECKECKPPRPNTFSYSAGGWLNPSEQILSAADVANWSIISEKIQGGAITSKSLFQLSKATVSYEIADNDCNLVNDFVSDYLHLPHNPTYNGTITIPNEWKMQLTHEKLLELHQFTQDHGIAYSHDIVTNSTKYHMQGTKQQVYKTLATIQAFLKGQTNELPAQPYACPNCDGKKYPGVYIHSPECPATQ